MNLLQAGLLHICFKSCYFFPDIVVLFDPKELLVFPLVLGKTPRLQCELNLSAERDMSFSLWFGFTFSLWFGLTLTCAACPLLCKTK